jgi:hypothetical protein
MIKKYPALEHPPGPEATEAERVIWRRKAAKEWEAITSEFVGRGIVEVIGQEWSPILQRQTFRTRVVAGVTEEEYRRLMAVEIGQA